MGKTFCRTFQAGLKCGNYFLGYHTPKVMRGAGCVKKLPNKIKKMNVSKVLLVTDPNIRSLGLIDGLVAAMEEKELPYAIFSDLQANPTDENVEAGFKVFRDECCDGIIAFGGGSAMDCAKGIAAKDAHPNKSIEKLQGILKVHKQICPFFAVPTTAGTGSETTVAAVITIAKTKHKASINDPCLLPYMAVLDPELTVGLPAFVTATTGMDALCHAVESYTNWTYCTKEEKVLSKRAVQLIYENLYDAYKDGSNIEARQNMQLAAFYAGRSFTRGCVGYVHACGHPLSALYGLPHGLVMGVILPHVMKQFGPAVYKRLAELADVCGMKGSSDKEKAEKFIAWIDGMNAMMGLPTGFSEIKKEDVPQMITWADQEANPLYPVPVVWKRDDFVKLYKSIMQ